MTCPVLSHLGTEIGGTNVPFVPFVSLLEGVAADRRLGWKQKNDDAMRPTTIPSSVLNLLAKQWPADNEGRRLGPARYLYRHDDSASRINGGLWHSQVRGLVADQVLTNDGRGAGMPLPSERKSRMPYAELRGVRCGFGGIADKPLGFQNPE